MNTSNPEAPDRNLTMGLVRVIESAALAAGQQVSRDQKEEGDGAAVDAVRQLINTVAIDGVIVIGKGEEGEAPMLFNGEKAGNSQSPAVDIAANPIDGTTLVAEGCPSSITVLAAADRGSMYNPSAVFYMDKIAVDSGAAGEVNVEAPVECNIKVVAKAKGLRSENVTVVMLDRPRHADMIHDIREAGARVRLVGNGGVTGAVAAAQNTNSIDTVMDVGGTPEGIIAVCAMKCMGGKIQGKLHPHDEVEIKRALDAGHDLSRILTTDDLVASDSCYFVATGVASGDMLRGIAYRGNGAWTRSLVMCSRSGTIHRIKAFHSLEKLRKYAGIDYGRGEVPDIDL